MKQFISSIISWATNTGIRVLIALILLLISFKVINFIAKRIKKGAEKRNLDKTILNVLIYLIKIGGKCLVSVCLIGYVGIDTSGITALITSLGVCFGLAVNGALANLAGGVLLIFTRPFRVDDYIEAQGVSGTVTDIYLTNTKIVTPDNKVIYVPNGTLANGTIINYSEKDNRRVDMSFMVEVSSDTEKAKEIVRSIIVSHPLVLHEPSAFVRVSENGRDGVKITGRGWSKNGDYWTVYFDVLESVKAEFEKNGIKVPTHKISVDISK